MPKAKPKTAARPFDPEDLEELELEEEEPEEPEEEVLAEGDEYVENMTIRDVFAAAILAGWAASPREVTSFEPVHAYSLADDALMARRGEIPGVSMEKTWPTASEILGTKEPAPKGDAAPPEEPKKEEKTP
jgi:hypothetical protein